MEQKTKLTAHEGSQDLLITRVFDLPLGSLFRAFEEPSLFEQWMNTRVLKMENANHGSYAFETSHNGTVAFRAHGTIHEFVPNTRITRTFEMEGTPLPVQLEFLEFEELTEVTSKLTMHIVFKSVGARDQLMQMPFARGLDMAHNRLQEIASQLK
ncbi:SRPBCC domain-containing protein [Sphingobacterium sp. BS-2]|uniref:SRPBCC domain-containing protein n=1 Tax=Sphingobacterium sp. BS-2 TaxID=3377129 RepID=UPI0038FC5E3C